MIRNMYLCLQARRGLILVCLINYMLHVSLTNEISLHIEPFQRKNPQRFYTFCKLKIYQSKKKLKKHIIVSLFGPELTYIELNVLLYCLHGESRMGGKAFSFLWNPHPAWIQETDTPLCFGFGLKCSILRKHIVRMDQVTLKCSINYAAKSLGRCKFPRVFLLHSPLFTNTVYTPLCI